MFGDENGERGANSGKQKIWKVPSASGFGVVSGFPVKEKRGWRMMGGPPTAGGGAYTGVLDGAVLYTVAASVPDIRMRV